MKIDEVFDSVIAHSAFANKEIGQNYLIDKNIAQNIVKLLEIDKKDNVIEIGAGFGSLSVFLVNEPFKSLTLNEIDPRSIEFLENEYIHKGGVFIINKSALKIDIAAYTKVIGNLPYYITSDLLEYYFTRCNAKKYVFMVQKEVIDRVKASPGSNNYGPLSILVNYLGDFKKEIDVNKNAFAPMPHIDSAVFSVVSNNDNSINKYDFLQFLKKMFLHRRKTIYNNLSLFVKDKGIAKKILDDVSIPLLARPEVIKEEEYLKIFKLVGKHA